MSMLPLPRYTQDQYLRFERQAEDRHEFIDGLIVAMAGGTETHALIATNTVVAIQVRVQGRCRVYRSDLRVCLSEARLLSYPDVTVVCGDRQFLTDHRDTLINPTLIVKVVSPSTEKYDWGHKSAMFRQMPTLRAYMLIAQQPVDIEYCECQSDGRWQPVRFCEPDAVVPVRPLGIELPASEIYLGVE